MISSPVSSSSFRHRLAAFSNALEERADQTSATRRCAPAERPGVRNSPVAAGVIFVFDRRGLRRRLEAAGRPSTVAVRPMNDCMSLPADGN
jgi:hypothetical protein